MKKLCMALAGVVLATGAFADNTSFHVSNRLRLGYDDNLWLRSSDKTDSFRIVDELSLQLNVVLKTTYLSVDYTPAATWYDERKDDEFDVYHNLTVNFLQDLGERLTLDVADTLRAGRLPELYDDNGYIVREDNDNYFNSTRASLMFKLTPETRLDLSGRYMFLTYDDDELHRYDNYDSWVAGLTLRHLFPSRTTGFVDFRYQQLMYDHSPENFNRDSDTIFGGVGLEQTFSRNFIGTLRGGVQQRVYDDDKLFDDQTQPYVEGSLTFLPGANSLTRFTFTASYSISESDISSYLSQERTAFSLSAAHEFTKRIGAFVSASYAHGEYDADYSLGKSLPGIDEDTYTVSARLSYKIAERNWLELNYQFLKLDSDSKARESYSDNRVDLAWKIQLF